MDTSKPRQKPGPRPKGFERQHVFLPPELADWAKDQPEGLSGLLRRLLAEEYQRWARTHKPQQSSDT